MQENKMKPGKTLEDIFIILFTNPLFYIAIILVTLAIFAPEKL